jgi:hypothetical protein
VAGARGRWGGDGEDEVRVRDRAGRTAELWRRHPPWLREGGGHGNSDGGCARGIGFRLFV